MLELLPEPCRKTFLACLRVLDNLWEVFGCSIVTDSMSTKFGFSKVLVAEELCLIVLPVLCFFYLKIFDSTV